MVKSILFLTILSILSFFFACEVRSKNHNLKSKDETLIDTNSIPIPRKNVNIDSSESDQNCCIDSILGVFNKDKYLSVSGFEIIEGRKIHFSKRSSLADIESKFLEKWLVKVDTENLKIYDYLETNKRYIIITAKPYKATGLAMSFYEWLVIDLDKGAYYQTNSISGRPECFYIDKKKQESQFIRFDFADSYWGRERTPYNIEFEVQTYKLGKRGLKLLSSFQSTCHCK